jgi:hypothetical protein
MGGISKLKSVAEDHFYAKLRVMLRRSATPGNLALLALRMIKPPPKTSLETHHQIICGNLRHLRHLWIKDKQHEFIRRLHR